MVLDSKEDNMCRTRVFTAFLIGVLFLFAGAVPAQSQPVKTNIYGLDGLFLATGGTTIPAGELVIGGSALIINDDDVDATSTPVTITYGASSDIEIAAAFEVYRSFDNGVDDDSGTGDLHLSAKYAVQGKTADYPATAVGVRVKLPLADQPLGTEETDFALFAASQLDMKSVTGILNVEYLIAGGDFPNLVNYVVGLQIPYSDTTDFTLELLDQPSIGDMFAGGATFDMGSSLNFGVAIGFGLEEDTSADFAAMGKIDFTF
jgi:hypothetical protein